MHLHRRLAALERRLIIEPTLLSMADGKIVRITANSDALLQPAVVPASTMPYRPAVPPLDASIA